MKICLGVIFMEIPLQFAAHEDVIKNKNSGFLLPLLLLNKERRGRTPQSVMN
jgi:hypothetical protein